MSFIVYQSRTTNFAYTNLMNSHPPLLKIILIKNTTSNDAKHTAIKKRSSQHKQKEERLGFGLTKLSTNYSLSIRRESTNKIEHWLRLKRGKLKF